MKSATKPTYWVSGSIGTDDITAQVILDTKNSSIHIHFYGEVFGSARKPILVKHSDSKFPEAEGGDLAKQLVFGELINKEVQVKSITTEKGTSAALTQPAQRTIIRFKK